MGKAQFSFEYIMIYGFALITIFLAISVLSLFLFVGDEDFFDSCYITEGFICEDYQFVDEDVLLRVTNTNINNIIITNMYCEIQDENGINSQQRMFVSSGETVNINCEVGDMNLSNVAINFVISYVEERGTTLKRTSGSIIRSNPDIVICGSGEICNIVDDLNNRDDDCIREGTSFTLLRDGEEKTFYTSPQSSSCTSRTFTCDNGVFSYTGAFDPEPDSSFIYPHCFEI